MNVKFIKNSFNGYSYNEYRYVIKITTYIMSIDLKFRQKQKYKTKTY